MKVAQKFHKGDHVRVAKNLGKSMSHFEADCEAIVIGSYNDKYGGGDTKSYTIHVKSSGQTSWYYEHQLEMIEPNRLDLLKKWEDAQAAEVKQKSDLDWIFANGRDVINNGYGASIQALANCLGLTNLWGSHGEGITYYSNAMKILLIASPFLSNGDKNGWIEFCKKRTLP